MPGDGEIDPRIVRTRHVVRQAALVELASVGFGGFTMESVARRARVSKSTMYSHWDGKLSLIADALEHLNQQPEPAAGGDTAREQIAGLLHHLASAMRDPSLSATVPALVEAAERDDSIARFHHAYNDRRRQTLIDLICAGVERGELRGDLDAELAALALAGAIVYRRLMTATPLPDEQVDDLVEQVLGVSAGAPPRR